MRSGWPSSWFHPWTCVARVGWAPSGVPGSSGGCARAHLRPISRLATVPTRPTMTVSGAGANVGPAMISVCYVKGLWRRYADDRRRHRVEAPACGLAKKTMDAAGTGRLILSLSRGARRPDQRDLRGSMRRIVRSRRRSRPAKRMTGARRPTFWLVRARGRSRWVPGSTIAMRRGPGWSSGAPWANRKSIPNHKQVLAFESIPIPVPRSN